MLLLTAATVAGFTRPEGRSCKPSRLGRRATSPLLRKRLRAELAGDTPARDLTEGFLSSDRRAVSYRAVGCRHRRSALRKVPAMEMKPMIVPSESPAKER